MMIIFSADEACEIELSGFSDFSESCLFGETDTLEVEGC